MTRRILIQLPWVSALAPKLAIVRAMLHQREDGPAITSGYEYIPGELMYLSLRIAGFHVQKDKMDVRYQIVVTDPDGLLVVPPISGGIQADVHDNDKDWLPKGAENILLPPQLPSGEFLLKIRAADEFAKTSAEHAITFRVKGRVFPAFEQFTIQGLRFFRTEQERRPLSAAEYRAGETVWGRFEMAGFKLGEKNRFDVEYGLSVFRPSGKLLYSEAKAAAEQDQPFYPKRLLEGALSLNLSPDMSPGDYKLVVTAKDNVGQQTATVESVVRVVARQ